MEVSMDFFTIELAIDLGNYIEWVGKWTWWQSLYQQTQLYH